MFDHQRSDVGVDHGGRQAFELAVLGQNAMRNRQRASAVFEHLRNLLLAARVGVTVKQADSEGLGIAGGSQLCDAPQFGRIEFKGDLAVEQSTLRDSNPHRTRYQRLRARRRQRIDVGAVLPPNLDQVLEAGIGEQRDLRPAPFQQGVSGDGRAIGEHVRDLLAD